MFTGVFNLYSIGYFIFIFSYKTIIVNLYDITHGKNNQLYNYFCFWFLCLYTRIFFFFFCFLPLAFVFIGVFNLYHIGYLFFIFFPI